MKEFTISYIRHFFYKTIKLLCYNQNLLTALCA